jgi:membrane-bound lytic murein transglycosylase D
MYGFFRARRSCLLRSGGLAVALLVTASATPTLAAGTTPAPAAPRPAAHPQTALAKKPAGKTKPGTATGKTSSKPIRAADPVTRHLVAGGPTDDDVAAGVESPELRALKEAERELFPPASPAPGDPWPTELPSPLSATEDAPRVHATGLPPAPPPSAPPLAEGGRDLSWLSQLQMPDLPVRWDARVVRYLEFFKDDPRGRQVLAIWTRRAGRYRELVRRTLRKKGLPEDLMWLGMVESTFDPAARSVAGAMGLWQFMPDTGRAYGLSIDRWADQRLNPEAATEAAADFLADLHRRFGSWELAIAAYNMGYWGVAGSVRKYNTNDFWVLSRLEAGMPWETTLYVPKILAAAIVGRNPQVFGTSDLPCDAPLEGEPVSVPPGTALAAVAQAVGCSTKEIEQLNPELRASRTPPAQPPAKDAPKGAPPDPTANDYPVRVPVGRSATGALALARLRTGQPALQRYVVRFGESLEQIAATQRVPLAKLVELNAISPGEVVRGGTVLLVPVGTSPSPAPPPSAAAASATASAPPVKDDKQAIAVVPADIFVYPDRRRVFYRVTTGDTLREIADTFRVTIDEVRRWNDLDPAARLQDGMTIQLFVPSDADLSHAMVLGENDVRVLPVGSDEFFAYWESLKGRRRLTLTARDGETLAMIGNRYGMTPGMMERINHRSRGERLAAGDAVVVYAPEARAGAGTVAPIVDPGAPQPNGPLPDAPDPDALPSLPQ